MNKHHGHQQPAFMAGFRADQSEELDEDITAPITSFTENTPTYTQPSNDDNEIKNKQQEKQKGSRVLNGLHFSLMLFLVTSAGPFGIEALVKSSSPFYALLGIIVIPIIYCLPQSC